MTPAALALVLTAAIIHATWNLLAKRASGGAAFVWLFGTLSTAIYAPFAVAVVVFQRPAIGPVQILFLAGTAVLHLAYFLVLQRGYHAGDLSLVYPLARGTGPLLSTTVAIALLGERPGPIALAGAVLVVGSVFVLTGGARLFRDAGARGAIGYGILTGTLIASYTLWDKQAVSVLLIPPLLLDWASSLGRTCLLAPYAARNWDRIRATWWKHRREALGVAVLGPLSYILVLTALVFTPVSYVAPAREISIVVGAVLGTRLLAEQDAPRRLAAAAAIVLGVAALAVG